MINLVEWLRQNAGRMWQHKKRGWEYIELGRGELQIATRELVEGDTLIAYVNQETGKLYFRREGEFEDGRFKDLEGRADIPDPMTLPDDLFSHREDFRMAIAEMGDEERTVVLGTADEKEKDRQYWAHQLRVFDNISDFLDTLDVERVDMPETNDMSKAEAIEELTEGGEVERVSILPDSVREKLARGEKVTIGFGARELRPAGKRIKWEDGVVSTERAEEADAAVAQGVASYEPEPAKKAFPGPGVTPSVMLIPSSVQHDLRNKAMMCVDGEPLQLGTDIWLVRGGLAAHRDHQPEGKITVGLILVNDCKACLRTLGQTWELPVGSVYMLDGRVKHSALPPDGSKGLLAFLAWDMPADHLFIRDPMAFVGVAIYETLYPTFGKLMVRFDDKSIVERAQSFVINPLQDYPEVIVGALLQLLQRAGEALEQSGFADCYRAGYDAAVSKMIRDSSCDASAKVPITA